MKISKILAICGLAIMSVSVFAKGDNNGSILKELRNIEATRNTTMTPGHNRHDTDGNGSDDHMDGKRGNGYGHQGGNGGHNNNNGGGAECPPVPEPASMATLGIGAGLMALKRRRAAKKAA